MSYLSSVSVYNTRASNAFGVYFNLTQHELTRDQLEEIQANGWVVDTKTNRELIKELITFEELPSASLIKERVKKLMDLIKDAIASYRHENDTEIVVAKAMVGGAPFLMGWLENELFQNRVTPLYAFSKREVVETIGDDGSVTKQAVFRHQGFVHPAIR